MDSCDNKYIHIIGVDINTNININNKISLEYFNIMAKYQFIPCTTDLTCVTDRSKICMDHVFVKIVNYLNLKSGILQTSINDYFSTIVSINTHSIKMSNNNLRQTNNVISNYIYYKIINNLIFN